MTGLRDRLAEALADLRRHHGYLYQWQPDPARRERVDMAPEALVADILSAFPELERRYEVGAAVEGLAAALRGIERPAGEDDVCYDCCTPPVHSPECNAARAALAALHRNGGPRK